MSPRKPIPQNKGPSVADSANGYWREAETVRSIIGLTVDFFWESDKNHTITHFFDRDGHTLVPMVGRPFWELGGVPAYDGGKWANFKEAMERHQPFNDFLFKQPYPEIGLRYLNCAGQPIFDERDNFAGYQGVIKEVTARALHELLDRIESKITHLFNSSDTVEGVVSQILKTVCNFLVWDQGAYWQFSDGDSTPVMLTTWQRRIGENNTGRSTTTNNNKPGVREWISKALLVKAPQWITGLNDGAKASFFGGRGKQTPSSVMVVPVMWDDTVHGVMEFQNTQNLPQEEQTLSTLQRIATELARFIQKKLKEQQLQESQSRARYMLTQTSTWYWEMDADLRYTHFSGRVVDRNPHIFTPLIGKRPWEINLSIDRGWDVVRRYLEAHRPFENIVFYFHTPDGDRFDLLMSGDPVFNDDKKFIGYRGTSRNVTKRVEVEKSLKETQSHLDVMLASTGAGIYKIDFDRSAARGYTLSWSDNYARLYGCEKGQTLSQDDIVNRVHPDDLEIARATINHALRTGASEHQNEYRVVWPDGSVHWLFTSAKISRTSGGKPESMTGVVIDITDRKLIEQSLLETQEQLRTALTATNTGLYKLEFYPENFSFFGEKNRISWSFNMSRLYGVSSDGRATGQEIANRVHPDDRQTALKNFEEDVRNRAVEHKNEFRVVWPDGSVHWLHTHGTIHYEMDKPSYLIAILADITERKQIEEKIQYLATHDGLTGLSNREVFNQLLIHEIHASQRDNKKFAVMFIDLDRFKMINDTLGHDAGDVLLKEMASRLQNCLRSSDIVSRLGGDEFVVLARDINSINQVSHVARKILDITLEPIEVLGRECRVTASIGVAMYPDDGVDEQTLMKNADIAMYIAKDEGKNNCQFYSANVKSLSLDKLTLENDLRKALEREQFFLDYQAKMTISDGTIAGVEALLRWQHPQRGLVPPSQFIPLAEETSLIIPIGKWVLKEACRQGRRWLDQGLPPVCIAVNLSLRQFSDPHLLEDIKAALAETQLPPYLLELEITESMVMSNADRAVMLLKNIKSLGVRLAIDDFGTGYSSLGQLKQFPIDTLKVDRSFIKELPSDAEDKAITEAIIAMGKSLSLTVIAEGVETAQQEDFLRQHACDQMQGYYFSKPISAGQFAEFVYQHQRGKQQ